MIAHSSNRRGTRDEIVLVEVPLAAIKVGVKAQLRGVTLGKKILAENIRDENLLIAPVELVQIGVSVFFEHVEGDYVVLPEIVVVVAENADAEIRVVEDETAKIAHERLNAEPGGNEIVIIRQVADMNFRKCFLERIPIFFAPRVARVGEIVRQPGQSGTES